MQSSLDWVSSGDHEAGQWGKYREHSKILPILAMPMVHLLTFSNLVIPSTRRTPDAKMKAGMEKE
jgi:hypothetical protein